MHKVLLEMYTLLMSTEILKSWPPISQVKYYQHNPSHNEKKKTFMGTKFQLMFGNSKDSSKNIQKKWDEFRCLKIWQRPN